MTRMIRAEALSSNQGPDSGTLQRRYPCPATEQNMIRLGGSVRHGRGTGSGEEMNRERREPMPYPSLNPAQQSQLTLQGPPSRYPVRGPPLDRDPDALLPPGSLSAGRYLGDGGPNDSEGSAVPVTQAARAIGGSLGVEASPAVPFASSSAVSAPPWILQCRH